MIKIKLEKLKINNLFFQEFEIKNERNNLIILKKRVKNLKFNKIFYFWSL